MRTLILYSIFFSLFFISACRSTGIRERPFFVDDWFVSIQGMPKDSGYMLTFTSEKWNDVIGNSSTWNIVGDTLILDDFSETRESKNEKNYIRSKSMKYLLKNYTDNSFEAIPRFEEKMDSYITLLFEKN